MNFSRFPGSLALVLLLLLPAAMLRADALDGTLEVQSAFINVNGDVYQLHARIRYPLNDEMRAALQEGISLSFSLEAVIEHDRRFWFDAEIVKLTLRRELMFHALSDRYVVRDERTGEQSSHPTLEDALERVGAVDAWPVLVGSQLRGDGDYRVRVRAGVRRGRLPDALRALLFWTADWQRESEWYEWSLPR